MKTRILVLAVMMVCGMADGRAQSYAGDEATGEPVVLVDKPTAGLLKRATYAVFSNFFQDGGVLVGIAVGVFDQFSFGISYGGTHIIGPNKIVMNPLPGVSAKLRLFNEGSLMPALAIGFDSQGKEPYVDSLKRYTVKAPGAYVALSRNYAFLGNLSIHGGLTFSVERDDGDKDATTYVGLEKSIGSNLSMLAEYDFAFNDNHGRALGQGRGYLNLAFRYSMGSGLVIGVDLKNVAKNQHNISVANRTLQLDYIGTF